MKFSFANDTFFTNFSQVEKTPRQSGSISRSSDEIPDTSECLGPFSRNTLRGGSHTGRLAPLFCCRQAGTAVEIQMAVADPSQDMELRLHHSQYEASSADDEMSWIIARCLRTDSPNARTNLSIDEATKPRAPT